MSNGGARDEAADDGFTPLARGPVVPALPCSGCGRLIDPLRAGHVAIFDVGAQAARGATDRGDDEASGAGEREGAARRFRFHYFCDRSACRAAFLNRHGHTEAALEATALRPAAAPRRTLDDEPIRAAFAPAPDPELPLTTANDDDPALVEPLARTILTDETDRYGPSDARDVGALLLVMAIIAGALAVALALAGEARLVIGARVVLAAVGAGMLLGRAATTSREPTDPHPVALLVAPLGALAVAGFALFGKDHALAAEAASLAGVVVTAAALGAALAESARRPMSAEREWIAAALAIPGRRVAEGAGATNAAVFDMRPGERLLVESGEVVPVDATVVGEGVDVLPWLGATTTVRRREGSAVVAGAEVASGTLRAVCTWSGHDRAFARVLLDPRRRADAFAPIAQASRRLVERWALAAAVVGGVSATLAGRESLDIAMAVVAILAAIASAVAGTIASAHVARAILLGLRRGIVYRSADAWDRAGKVAVATFCARGTLLLGEPELAELEAMHPKLSPSEVLALAAGAERAEEHPIATAIVRAARTRNVRADGVRNASLLPGLGVTAVSSSGEELAVGSRGLMFERRISIAQAEGRISELENLGRTVVVVALGGRLVGVLGLQDGLRPGARAAVQHLLDARIEPVLMSGDARETCETIARSLDIDHVRPEVLPSERGAEVRRLVDTGASVAVLGHIGVDDAALGAADVAVAIGAAGSTPGEFAVGLASDDVRDAALSLSLARRSRDDARIGLALAAVPALVGSVAVGFGILPPAYAPIASLIGGAMAVAHLKRT